MRMADLENWRATQQLVQREMRVTLITSITGVTARSVRQLWYEVHGHGARNGKLPESASTFLTSQQDCADLSAYIAMHAALHREEDWLTAAALIQTVDICRHAGVRVDINAAYYVARDVASGELTRKRCGRCHARYLYSLRCEATLECPYKDVWTKVSGAPAALQCRC